MDFIREMDPLVSAGLISLVLIVLSFPLALVLQFVAERFEREADLAHQMPTWARLLWPLLLAAIALVLVAYLRPVWLEALTVQKASLFWVVLGVGLWFSAVLGRRASYWWETRRPGVPAFTALLGIVAVAALVTELSFDPSLLPIDEPESQVNREGVWVDVKPWGGGIKVGESVLIAVSVTNNSGGAISELSMEPDEDSDPFIGGSKKRAFGNLPNTGSWGPELFPVRLPAPGVQTVAFKLGYRDDDSQDRKEQTGRWEGKVVGPELEVSRYIFSGQDIVKDQEIDVRLLVKNIGQAPAYGLHLEPNLLGFFDTPGGLLWPDILEPGEEFPASYKAIATAAGDGPLASPIASFRDGAGNLYDNSRSPESTPLRVLNYFCANPSDCVEGHRITVLQPPIGSTPRPPIVAPPVLEIAHSSKHAQFAPGAAASHNLVLSHDGDGLLQVLVSVVDEDGLTLKWPDVPISLPAAGSEVSGNVKIPSTARLGVYQPTVNVQLLDESGRPLGVPRNVQLSFEVTLVKIDRRATVIEMDVGQEVTVETSLANDSQQPLRVRFTERLSSESGMSVTGETASPPGAGSSGSFFFATFELGPGKVEKRTFTLQANEAGTHSLNGAVHYELADGRVGSASRSTRFIVVNE